MAVQILLNEMIGRLRRIPSHALVFGLGQQDAGRRREILAGRWRLVRLGLRWLLRLDHRWLLFDDHLRFDDPHGFRLELELDGWGLTASAYIRFALFTTT